MLEYAARSGRVLWGVCYVSVCGVAAVAVVTRCAGSDEDVYCHSFWVRMCVSTLETRQDQKTIKKDTVRQSVSVGRSTLIMINMYLVVLRGVAVLLTFNPVARMVGETRNSNQQKKHQHDIVCHVGCGANSLHSRSAGS